MMNLATTGCAVFRSDCKCLANHRILAQLAPKFLERGLDQFLGAAEIASKDSRIESVADDIRKTDVELFPACHRLRVVVFARC